MRVDGFQELLRRAQAGEQSAAEQVLNLVRDHLARTADRFSEPGRADVSTSDLVQDASLKLWQRLPEFRGGQTDEESLAKFLVWSRTIVTSLGLNAVRDGQAQCRNPEGGIVSLEARATANDSQWSVEPPAAGLTPSANVRADEEAELIRAAINRLPDEVDRTLLRLRFFDGQSLRQIAEVLPLSYDQIRDRYQSLMKRLERELGGLL